MNQKTLKREISFGGIGVHSGAQSSIALKPCDGNQGIIFIHTQIPNDPIIIGTVIPETALHATVIKGKSWAISTIEHLMAAIMYSGLDNVIIEVQGTEIPILDGSALSFVLGILQAGFQEQKEIKKFLTPKELLFITDQSGRKIEITPNQNREFHLEYSAEFEHQLIGTVQLSCTITEDYFAKSIAPARTFGFLEQLPFLRHHGLAKGTSLGNTVVIGRDEYLNEPRFPDECIRHKILDLLGDLSLLGKRLSGTVKAHKTGHAFNRLVTQHYVTHPDQWALY